MGFFKLRPTDCCQGDFDKLHLGLIKIIMFLNYKAVEFWEHAVGLTAAVIARSICCNEIRECHQPYLEQAPGG